MSIDRRVKINFLRRLVMAVIFLVFILQYFRVGLLTGSLSASVLLGKLKLLDVFAFLESSASAREITSASLAAVLPVVALYLLLGRAFCGWVCPMDFLFTLAARGRRKVHRIPPSIGYGLAAVFLAFSYLAGVPLFANYFSHLTNIFRAAGSAFTLFELPGSLVVFAWSGGILLLLLLLDYFQPRLWCRVLCPVGKAYGLLNRISLLRLHLSGKCSGCGACEDACYMGVQIVGHRERRELRHSSCIYCGRCMDVCREKENGVRMGFRTLRRNL